MCQSYLKFLIIIAFGILFLSPQLQANSKLESLKDQLNSRIDDELRDTLTFSLYNQIIRMYFDLDTDSAIAYGNRALDYFNFDIENKYFADLHNYIAASYSKQKKFKEALDNYTSSKKYYQLISDSVGLINTYNNIAFLYKDRNLYDLSLKYFKLSLSMARKQNTRLEESWILSNIAFLFKDKNDLDSALHYLDAYQKIKRDRESISEVAQGYNYYGQIYEAFGKHEKALENFKKGHDLANELNQDPLACSLCQWIGRVYMKLGMYDSADTYLTKNYKKLEKFERYIEKFRIHYDLANLRLAQERYDEAESLMKEAISLAERNNEKNDLSESLKLYVAILKKKGNLESALEYNEYLNAIKDSIILMNSNIAIYDLEVNSELLATEKEIEYYQKSTDLYKIIIIFAFISLLSIAALFYFRLRGKAKANLVLQEKNKLIEDQKGELASTNKELLKSKNRLSRLLNKHNAIMYLVDPESFKILDANEAAQKFYGYSQSEFLNMKITDLNILDEDKIRDEIDKSFARNEGYFVFKHRLKSGEIRDVEIRAVPVEYDEGKNVFFAVVHDITQRLKALNDLKFSEKRQKELNATKDKFFSIIAHDLKNPLGSFKQLVETITNEYETMETEDMRELLVAIRDLSQHTYDLLENLLTWSRAQRGQIEYNPVRVDLSFLAYNTVSLLQIPAKEKEIKIIQEIPKDTYVMADANMITTVFRNLVSNAVKFTPESGVISIHVTVEEKYIRVGIKDTGVGIAEDDLNKLFRIDVQYTTPGTNNEKGTGLGLILCHEFVSRNGGKIWVESKIDSGTEFIFTLPKAIG